MLKSYLSDIEKRMCIFNPLDINFVPSLGLNLDPAASKLPSEEFRMKGEYLLNFMTQQEGLSQFFLTLLTSSKYSHVPCHGFLLKQSHLPQNFVNTLPDKNKMHCFFFLVSEVHESIHDNFPPV